MNLLHIDSSIQGAQSASRSISAAVVERLRGAHPALTVTYRDLATDPLPHLTLDVLADPEANAELRAFEAADIVVIGAGMYNFSIPSQLKAWLDRIIVAGRTFGYGPDGVKGLSGDKRVFVALARGGLFGVDSPVVSLEHAETYLRGVLEFIGIGNPVFVHADGLAMGEEARASGIAQGLADAQAIAA
ncbi:FMN-dependent NADH-azoreductase [Sphingomonas sp. LT1P40]|uniref:FMN-dependent NADH-azoreductase n=1 Tax=Alteristakelama amylovorans TaxID=3096166 RepID=UPI002FC5D593